MTATRSIAGAIAATLVFAGCGGGGGSAVPTSPVSTPAGNGTAAQRTPVATGTLTIVLPSSYHVVQRGSKQGARKPAFVDPTPGTVLDIYVDGTEVFNLDGVTPSDSATVVSTGNGTLTIANVPFYSTQNDVAIIQWDSSSHTTIQALGEATGQTVTPGGTNAITLSMQMNATGVAITTFADGSSAYQFAGTGGEPCLYSGQQFYLYPIDSLGVLAIGAAPGVGSSPSPSGFGGIPVLTPTSVASPNDGSGVSVTQLGAISLYWANISTNVTMWVTYTNPASLFYNNTSQYPTLNALYTNATVNFSTVPTSAYQSTNSVPFSDCLG